MFAWSASFYLNFHSQVTICGRAVNKVTGCGAGSGRPLGPPSLVAKGCNGLGVGLTTLLHLLRGYLWADLYLQTPHTSLWCWPYSHGELPLTRTLSQNNNVIFPKGDNIFFQIWHGIPCHNCIMELLEQGGREGGRGEIFKRHVRPTRTKSEWLSGGGNFWKDSVSCARKWRSKPMPLELPLMSYDHSNLIHVMLTHYYHDMIHPEKLRLRSWSPDVEDMLNR